MAEITMMWFDETKIMMKWKTQWTRTYSVAVGICPYGQLEEQHDENMFSKYILLNSMEPVLLIE